MIYNWLKLKKKNKEEKKEEPIVKNDAPIGFVDEINYEKIIGWVFIPSAQIPNLSITMQDKEFPGVVDWFRREDVESVIPNINGNVGFEIAYNYELRCILRDYPDRIKFLSLKAGEYILPFADDVFRDLFEVRDEEIQPFVSIKGLKFCSLNTLNPFALQLKIFSAYKETLKKSRFFIGDSLVKAYLEDSHECIIVSLIVHGELSRKLTSTAELCLSIEINNNLHQIDGLVLLKADVKSWIVRVFKNNFDNCEQLTFDKIQAVEHLRNNPEYIDSFSGELVNLIQVFVRENGLIPIGNTSNDGHLDSVSFDTEEAELWRLMNILNDRLISNKSSQDDNLNYLPDILEVFREINPSRQVKNWFLSLAVQLCCESNELGELNQEVDLSFLLQNKPMDGEHYSLVLAYLGLKGYHEEYYDLLRNNKKYNTGWLHYPAILFSIKLIFNDNAISKEYKIKCLYCVMDFFDSRSGVWFSRHSDYSLISLASLIVDYSFSLFDAESWQAKEIRRKVLKNYSLHPYFWDSINAFYDWSCNSCADLDEAYNNWIELQCSIENYSADIDFQSLGKLLDCCLYFVYLGNVDVILIIRSLVMNSYQAISSASQQELKKLVNVFALLSDSEVLRLISYPIMMTAQKESLFDASFSTRSLVFRSLDQSNRLDSLYSNLFLVVNNLKFPNFQLSDLNQFSDVYYLLDELLYVEFYLYWLLLSGKQNESFGVALERQLITDNSSKIISPVLSAIAFFITKNIDNELIPISLKDAAAVRLRNADTHVFDCLANIKGGVCGAGWPSDTLFVFDDTAMPDFEDLYHSVIEKFNFPYLFLKNSNKKDSGLLDGHHLTIPVASSLESKSSKLLLFSWILNNTSAQYIVIIEKGYYLDINEFLTYPYYRRSHYYGWVEKNTCSYKNCSAEDKVFLEYGAETTFTNGIQSFSRHAICCCLEVINLEIGKKLSAGDFSENLLIALLLKEVKILPSNEKFVSHTCSDFGGNLVKQSKSYFPNKYLPSSALKYGENCDSWRQAIDELSIKPAYLFPVYSAPSLKENSNHLELLSDIAGLMKLLKSTIVVIVVVRNELNILPWFLNHYRKNGFCSFVFIDNCSDDGTREYLLSQSDVAVFSANTEYRMSHYGVSWQSTILGNLLINKWVLIADADEFLVFKNCENTRIDQFLANIDKTGADGVLTYMIDMYPYGDLADASFTDSDPFHVAPYFDKKPLIELKFGGGLFSNSRNYVNALRHRVVPARINAYVSQKYALFKYKPWMRFSEGIHYTSGMSISSERVFFAHYKYHSGFKDKVLEEIERKQHFNGAEEYKKYIGMFSEGNGFFGDEHLSVKYVDSNSFYEIFENN